MTYWWLKLSWRTALMYSPTKLHRKTHQTTQEVLFIDKKVCWHFREVTTDKVLTAGVTGILEEDGGIVQCCTVILTNCCSGMLVRTVGDICARARQLIVLYVSFCLEYYFHSIFLIRILTIMSSRLIVNILYCSEKKFGVRSKDL